MDGEASVAAKAKAGWTSGGGHSVLPVRWAEKDFKQASDAHSQIAVSVLGTTLWVRGQWQYSRETVPGTTEQPRKWGMGRRRDREKEPQLSGSGSGFSGSSNLKSGS